MVSLNRKELEEEIAAVKHVLELHKSQVTLNEAGIKANTFIKDLLEKELAKLPPAKVEPIKPKESPVGVG